MSPRGAKGSRSGLSLIVTLVVTAGVAVLVGSILCLTATRSNFTRRMGQYQQSVAAAVAATQKVHARITTDFQRGGDTEVNNNLSNYRGLVPTTAEVLSALAALNGQTSSKPPWSDDQFLDASGQVNQTSVQKRSDWAFRDLQTRLVGLRGYAADYTITSSSRRLRAPYQITSSVKQDIQVASIPIFQYQLFYVPDMEVNPSGAGMTFNGRVHCNGNIYCKPEGVVTFLNHVTAAKKFINGRHPADPVTPGPGYSVCRAERVARVNTLNIPVGGTTTNLRSLIEYPPVSELPVSPLGQQRFYNKAELVVLISNGTVFARSGAYNAGLVPVPWIESRGIVTSGKKIFFDKRESRDSSTTEINVAAFLANYNDLTALLGRPVKTLWISDFRQPNSTTIWGIRVLNGQTLPTAGLTIATPNSMYVYGHYNAPAAALGTTNTAAAAPACLACDSITFLSPAWVDGNGPKNLADRPADDMTVNAAIITGIVPTGGGNYSGGVENVIRTLENWSGKTITFNGAVAVLFHSQRANSPWGGPDVYAPPTRKYNYDPKLSQSNTLPPSTPEVRTILHSDWTIVTSSSPL